MRIYCCDTCHINYCVKHEHCPVCGIRIGRIIGADPSERILQAPQPHKKKKDAVIKVPLKLEDYESLWFFIKDPVIRYNIASHQLFINYLIQYHEEVYVYGIVESLMIQDVVINISQMIEVALYSVLKGLEDLEFTYNGDIKDSGQYVTAGTFFHRLIASAGGHGIFTDNNMIGRLIELKDKRNMVHLARMKQKIYKEFSVNDLVVYTVLLRDFIAELQSSYFKNDKFKWNPESPVK